MKSVLLTCIFLGLAAQAFADDLFEESSSVDHQEGRFLYFNTSSTATSLTLLGALILLGVIGYLIYAGGLLGGGAPLPDGALRAHDRQGGRHGRRVGRDPARARGEHRALLGAGAELPAREGMAHPS